ncbi:hypothetical protein BH10BDE1_BH10BDE1_22340 [soil metagenome]
MFSSERPVRRFLIAQTLCVILAAVGTAVFWGRIGLLGALLGGGVAMINAAGTAFAWPRILEKKDVALALSIIVSKFALSIGIFYWLTLPSSKVWAAVWFGIQTESSASNLSSASGTLVALALGLASVVPAALVVAVGDFRPNK